MCRVAAQVASLPRPLGDGHFQPQTLSAPEFSAQLLHQIQRNVLRQLLCSAVNDGQQQAILQGKEKLHLSGEDGWLIAIVIR